MKLTGSEIIVEYLIREGVPYALGIPGHGAVSMFDAFIERSDKIKMLQVRHEQSAVHFADAFYRVSGKPLAVFTSIGPGATNTVVGLATAYVDSIPVLVITGAVHTHMMGRGVLQEIEQVQWGNFPRIIEPIVKRYWRPARVDHVPYVMHRAFNEMLTGRRGPVHIDMPMDIQSDVADVELPEPGQREPLGRTGADREVLERIADLLLLAERPAIVAGGGVLAARASQELVEVAEFLGAPTLSTFQAKGVFPENHELAVFHTGSVGTTCGHKVANSADVLLAVGTRFADLACSSYVPGTAYSIPPTKLIHIDIDPGEIGKNYPVEIGLAADAKSALEGLLEVLREHAQPKNYREMSYFKEVQELKREWHALVEERARGDVSPATVPYVLRELRRALDDDAIVISSAGTPQAWMIQAFEFYVPGTNLTSGGFSTMGFTIPAALGAKVAAPDRQVVGVAGDGDFLMTVQELAMAAQYNIPAIIVVLNNVGWGSIRDLQISAYGANRVTGVEFRAETGEIISPNLALVAQAFGVRGERIERPDEVRPALERALNSGRPSVVEVMVNREHEHSRAIPTGGWWDMPVPSYLTEKRSEYMAYRIKEALG